MRGMVRNKLGDIALKNTESVCRNRDKVAQRKRDGVKNDVRNDRWNDDHGEQ